MPTLLFVVLRYCSVSGVQNVYRIAVFGFLVHHLGVARMASGYSEEIAELTRMQDRLRKLRDRLCEPKNNRNPRYHALSAAVSQLGRAIDDLKAEGRD
jgi:hypothetical protein